MAQPGNVRGLRRQHVDHGAVGAGPQRPGRSSRWLESEVEAWMQQRFPREQVKSAMLQAYLASRVGVHLLDIEDVESGGGPSH